MDKNDELLIKKKRKTEKNVCKQIFTKEECDLNAECKFSNKTLKCRKKYEKNKLRNSISIKQSDGMSYEKSDGMSYEKSDGMSYEKSEEKPKENPLYNETSKLLFNENESACDQLEYLRNELNIIRKNYDTKIRECEEFMFGKFIEKYFNKGGDKLTHEDLLIGLQTYYTEEKTKDINFILSMQEFIQKFSQKTPVKGSNYKRQHIFEAICRLLVFFNYDKDELGVNKTFYKSLESYIAGSKNNIDDLILNTKVNEGSSAGIVDIFFKSKKSKKNDNQWACETISKEEQKEEENPEDKDEYIMIQNKYYDKEKSNISNYDVTRIYTLADRTKKEEQKFNGETRLILMVNNGDAVSSNLLKAKQQYPGLLDSRNGIIGISILDNWFQQMLYDLYVSKTITKFIEKNGKKSEKSSIQLRFHQKFIIECTKKCIENNISKVIWGAVPRSGKSYMIGGLISDRINNGHRNNIVIILGALTETLQQFKDMFKNFSNFDEYKIISSDFRQNEGDLNIYLFSQEWLKDKVGIDVVNKKMISSSAKFNEKIKSKYPKMFETGKIDLYFDEVHKGGSTDISEGIIHSFNNEGVKIDIFIMVTATFAKPTLRYDNVNFIGIGNNKTEIIEWSYNDQQNMKYLTDETKKDMMVNTRNGIQQEVLNNIFTFYQTYYGSDYLNALSKEYQKYPELVLITPECINVRSSEERFFPSTIDIRNVFLNNLQCDACAPSKSIDFYKNPANIFNQNVPVDDLLNSIWHNIYNYFRTTLKYPIDSPHTELWFLPDKHLYGTASECRNICKSDKNDSTNQDEDDIKSFGIPNIEPLTRGLSIKICNHEGFKKYNVLIVHNTKFNYLGSDINSTNIFSDFKDEKGKKRIDIYDKKKASSLAEQIKDFEKNSYKNGKSLIILTGAKLRLGISLPCADIAFNFDDIMSIDNNYQTMFRVLTERTKPEIKQYGYYLDFNKSRSIRFIYEYNKIYGQAKKLQTKEALEALQSLLFTFNYNGLNLIKNNTKDELNLYNDLVSKLDLNEEGFTKFWSKKDNIVSLIKKSLVSTENIKLLQQLKSFMSGTVIKAQPKQKQTVKEGQSKEQLPFIVRPDTELEGEEEEGEGEEPEKEQEPEEDYGELINSIAEELPTIIALFAIFSNDEGYECQNIEECLKTNLDKIDRLEEQCSCENIKDASILDCFLNSPGLINNLYKYKKSDLEKIIKILLEIINSSDELLRNNLNLIFDNIKKLMTKNDGIINDMSDKDIEEKIEQYLSVREEEKNKHGEVFTPIGLIDEMLDKLPPSVWSNPDLKWLDPANGIGNFPMVAYRRLMKGLEKWEPNNKKRSKHIIEKMLYMVEINPKNVKIAKKIFGSNANICCADFLSDSEKCFTQFGVSKFDVIIGNPPFNEGGVGKGGGVLWKEFVFKSFELLLNDKGFLVFVHPTGWRKPSGERASAGDVWVEFKKHNLIFLKISDIKIPHFPTVDYYVVQKNAPQKETYLINEFENNRFEGKIDLYDLDFIPHFINSDVKTILNKVFSKAGEKFNIIRNQSFQPAKADMYREGTPHTYYYDPTINNYINVYKKYKNDAIPEYIDKDKIIMTFSNGKKKGLLYPKYYNQTMGTTSGTMYQLIETGDNQSSYVTLLNSELINFILKITQYSEPPNYKNEFKILNMISKPNKSKLTTEGDVYRYYNLTQKEIKIIRNILKKEPSLEENITKIQAVIRGRQQRKKTKETKKVKSDTTKLQTVARGVRKRKKTRKQDTKQRGNKKTRKNKSLFKFW